MQSFFISEKLKMCDLIELLYCIFYLQHNLQSITFKFYHDPVWSFRMFLNLYFVNRLLFRRGLHDFLRVFIGLEHLTTGLHSTELPTVKCDVNYFEKIQTKRGRGSVHWLHF